MLLKPSSLRHLFLNTTLIGALAATLAVGVLSPTKSIAAQDSTCDSELHILQPTGQVDTADALFRQQVEAWAAEHGFYINVEIVDFRAIDAKIAAALAVQGGPDMIMMQDQQTWQWRDNLVPVTDLVEELDEQLGGVYDGISANTFIDGEYLSVPYTYFPQGYTYRTDLLSQVGYDHFPTTMDEFLDAGQKLREIGYPVGVALAATNGDARAWVYSVLWSFGATELDEEGNINLDSEETRAALAWAKEFLDTAADPTGFGWDGGGNNRAFAAGLISATNNSPSVFAAALADPEMADVTANAVAPEGPGGGWFYSPARQYAIAQWSNCQAEAQELIHYLLQPEQYLPWLEAARGFNFGAYHFYDDHPYLAVEPRLQPFMDILSQSRFAGYPLPPDANSSQVWEQDVILNMFVAVNNGTPIDEAIATAVSQMELIYSQEN